MPNKALVPHYDSEQALRVCEGVLEGRFLQDILKEEGMPSRSSWYRWLLVYPELKETYERARQLSAELLEEDALAIAKQLLSEKGLTGLTPLQLDGIKAGLTQYRWSAARRDPSKFAERPAVQVAIPIQINTSLDLTGQGKPIGTAANVYHITVERPVGEDGAPLSQEEQLLDAAEDVEVLPETALDPPVKPKAAAIRKKAEHRKKGHKTAAQTRATMAAYARKRNNVERREKGEPTK